MKLIKSKAKKLQLAVVEKMITLSTAAFGVVAALAWNNVIQEFVKNYIQPLIGGTSGMWSLLIYAVLVTALAVAVTMWLSRVEERLK